ncbi:TPA_asm: P [Artemisia betacytorhabdovirus 1]|nr:TPA_asm: P [Artemisia betacytorhabdovirus 1]
MDQTDNEILGFGGIPDPLISNTEHKGVLQSLVDEGGVFDTNSETPINRVSPSAMDSPMGTKPLVLEKAGAASFVNDGKVTVVSSVVRPPPNEDFIIPGVYINVLKHRLTNYCKSNGIEMKPEYFDILFRLTHEKKHYFSEVEIEMFVVGMMTERRYSIFTSIKEMAEKLESSLKLSQKLEIQLKDKLEKDKSEVVTEMKRVELRIIEELKSKEEKEPQVHIKSNKVYDEKEWVASTSKMVSPIVAKSGGKRLSAEELDNVDVSNLQPIPFDSTFNKKMARYLGWPEDFGMSPKFFPTFLALPKELRLIIANDLLDEGGQARIRSMMTKKIEELSAQETKM